METTYAAYPSLAELSISERTDAFKRTCLNCIQTGQLALTDLVQATEEALAGEHYELAQGIELARQEFTAKPQLGLSLK